MSFKDFLDFNDDGKVDEFEELVGLEMACSSREEYETLFGDAGEFDEEYDDEEDVELDLELAGLDYDELSMMDEDERNEALEEAGLDPFDFDF